MSIEPTDRRDGDERLREEHRSEDQRIHVENQPDTLGIFDAHNPPADERISDCVHCGFCLPTCPTYTLWGEEMDSPRGRIYLMKLGKEGAVPLETHMPSTSTLPGLHGLCDGLPVRREVRRVDRGRPPPAGAQLPAQPCRPPVPGDDLPALPVPDPAARRRRRGCALPTRGRSLPAGAQRAAQAAAGAAAGGRGADAAGAAARPDPAVARVHPGAGHRAAAPRRHAGGMRPAGVLPRRQRGNGARAGPGRLRRDCAARAAVLRRAQRARRPGTGGAEEGPSTDRRFRTRRCGRHRGERGRLRLHDEGVRPAVARRPGVRRTGGGVLGEGARHLGGARRPGAGRARGTPSRPGSPTTTPAISRTASASGSSRGRCCAPSRAWR